MLTLHLIADNSDPKRIDRAIEYLVNTKQRQATVAAGSQVDVGMNIVERIHARLPNCQIFWRVLEDTGSMLGMGANAWWQDRVVPRLKWMQDHKLVMVVDNDFSGSNDEVKRYVAQGIIRANLLHNANLGGAFCRFSTGNIDNGAVTHNNQYPLLVPLLEALTPLDWVSPNEYSNMKGKSSSGHLQRYKYITDLVPKTLNISIGEAGILDDYRARDGYIGVMTGEEVAAQLLSEEMWYRGGAIARHIFVIGGYQEWARLQVNDAILNYLEAYYAQNPISQIPPTVPPPPVITPPPIPTVPLLTSVELSYLESWRDTMQAQVNILNKIIVYAKGVK